MDREELKQKLKSLTDFAAKYRYLLLVILCGVVLMLLPRGEKSESVERAESTSSPTEEFSLEREERRIEEALALVEGVGRVRVVLSLKTTMETIYQLDTRTEESISGENERRDGTSDTVIVSVGSGAQQPVWRKRIYPVYQGALVVCEGGDRAEVRLRVSEAVSALTGLAANRITVARYE